ncbi:hypothetical protein NA56DRAFT_662266 [Hyaloscypha hepaticicola]|uniref:2EXR domain-containing protein n=1 Tax=Hyaloscypha hepaticicola TaxID=2082293 RepID=A0A2J6PTB2_9HELO|nr:hypothetical protein NA56DRAFT_662266 [Hyaloscypha hepaticicola]
MNNSSNLRRRRLPVTLSASSTFLHNNSSSSTNSPQTAAPNNQQVVMASSAVHNNIAFKQEEDSLEKSSTIPQATHPTAFIKQEAHEDVEETIKFTVFPKLPRELRRKIWVMSFESKEFGIDILPPWYKSLEAIMPFSETPTISQTERIFPASLRVNAESRAETMRHYSFVSLSDAFEDLPSLPKYCLNLGLDCLFLNYLDSIGKGSLATLKHLEVKDFDWGGEDSTPDHRYEVQNEQLRPGTTDPSMLLLMKFILRLTGLQVLCLTWDTTAYFSVLPRNLLKLDESRAMIQEFLGRHKDNFCRWTGAGSANSVLAREARALRVSRS